MFSLGMAASRVFSIAFWSARFAAGSGPPSRAATMIARTSFEKSWPRLASVAPFFRLIDAHLLCPDKARLPDCVQEHLVHPRIVGQFGVESSDDQAFLPEEHGLTVELAEHFDVVSDLLHARRADEDASQRPLVAGELEVGLEARNLAPVGVALDAHVQQAEVVTAEDDQSGTGPKNRPSEAPDRVFDPVQAPELSDRCRLATGDNEPIQILQLFGLAHLDDLSAEPSQHRRVLAKVPLDSQDADPRLRHYQPRVSSSSSGGSVAVERPVIASPRPCETRASTSASW